MQHRAQGCLSLPTLHLRKYLAKENPKSTLGILQSDRQQVDAVHQENNTLETVVAGGEWSPKERLEKASKPIQLRAHTFQLSLDRL